MTVAQVSRLTARAGDPAPFIHGMTKDKAFYSFEAQAGRPAVLILAGTLSVAATLPLVQAFQRRLPDFAGLGADAVLVLDGYGDAIMDYVNAPPAGLQVVYSTPDTFTRWGCPADRAAVAVIDLAGRLVAALDPANGADHTVAATLDAIAGLPAAPAADDLLPAPVLIVPRIFTPEFCQTLIDHFEASPRMVGGMAGVDAAGAAVHKVNETQKRRQDVLLAPDHPLYAIVAEALARRCVTEIKKVFQCDTPRLDRILIARYDDTGGYFLRHRDNSAPAVAFRQFALSVNLNDAYEGGHLLFPEYNNHRYRPGGGSGVIFSASLLHEATPVTKGQRYVLLTFFYSNEAEARRVYGG